MKLNLSSYLIASAITSVSGATNTLRGSIGHRALEEDVTFLLAVHEDGKSDSWETLNVEFSNGATYELTNADATWAKGAAKGLQSGVDRIQLPANAVINSQGKIDMKGGKPKGEVKGFFGRDLEESGVPRTEEQERNLAELRRRQLKTGTRSVLAVRVVTTDKTVGYGEAALSDDVFGTTGDVVNLRTQYSACSHGQLDFQPISDKDMTSNPNDGTTNIRNGVVTIKVNNASTEGDGVVRPATTNALTAAFGIAARDLADHVMYCLPPGTMSGIAYAYINSWNSVFDDDWCRYVSVQMHEIGHNINLAHSGEGQTYDDQTGFMGYSYSQDDQKMCFNNAKSWQLGWFPDAAATIGVGQSYNGPLKGQVNYIVGDPSQDRVLVKIVSGSEAVYVGFNHQTKHNINTAEGGNRVTVQSYNGSGYSASTLLSKMSSGGSFSGNLGGQTYTINVGTITTNTDTGVAPVSITYGAPTTPPPTSVPATPPPTSPPTNPPTNFPTTPPAPTTSAPTKTPTAPPSPPPTKAPVPTNPPTFPPTNPPTPKPTVNCVEFDKNKKTCENAGCTWTQQGSNKSCERNA
mmetsp:Transcript_38211/g.68890  ORF Transcript_38211/g.68890 Transcript_38211/m.68890 type:complete len:576 (+) Transcript_38211:87-1814(+)